MANRQRTPEVTLAPPACGRDVANAARFGVPLAATRDPEQWQLARMAGRLTLCAPRDQGGLEVDLELRFGPLAQRLHSCRRSDPLPRACGLGRRAEPLTVIDAMAGLCRDAMVLSQLGCLVTAIERVPALAMLGHDAVEPTWLAPRMAVISAPAETWLQEHAADARPDVIYLDPMFATAGTAQVKKDMQICRLLAGPPDDPLPLLALARQLATDRVVVKRHHGAPPLLDGVSTAVEGERVRFDVYLKPR
ncbi:MAG: class I SAM-dependent methyltransferase [Planctomycetes bacterium]|nr:class I SAM-dependent methyltransferase [Planctomycetota bacterium]